MAAQRSPNGTAGGPSIDIMLSELRRCGVEIGSASSRDIDDRSLKDELTSWTTGTGIALDLGMDLGMAEWFSPLRIMATCVWAESMRPPNLLTNVSV